MLNGVLACWTVEQLLGLPAASAFQPEVEGQEEAEMGGKMLEAVKENTKMHYHHQHIQF